MADSGVIVSETLCPGHVSLELKIFSSLKGQVDSWPKKVKQHCLKVLHTHACVMIITRSSLPNNTNLKIERDQNKQHTLHPWLSAQFCRTLCARDMDGFNDCNPLQSTSFPLGWWESLPPICFLAWVYWTQTEQQTVWICQMNSEAQLVSIKFMHSSYDRNMCLP